MQCMGDGFGHHFVTLHAGSTVPPSPHHSHIDLSDDLQCSHWIKAELQGYDYTYAKFNVKIEPISFKDQEYETLLQHPNWTRSETDHLLFLCYEYDLRWPVIADRYEASSPRSVEELMQRYYFIISKLKSHRVGQSDFTSRNSASECYNIDYERARRKQQDLLFKKLVTVILILL
jgi:DNA methyltransferase 1-associated protein 1